MNVDWNAYDSNTDSEGSPNSQESERTLVEAVSVTSSVSLASTIVGSVTSSWYQEFDEISTPGSSASDVTMSDESNGDIGDQNVQYAMHPSRQFELDSNFDTFGPRISSQPTPNPPPLSSLLDTPSKKRKLDSSVKKSLTETEEDGATCSICLDFYDLVGQHRLVCLKCGHCFGESCIRRWIKEQQASKKCCPQCKIKASMRDIRYIFADRLRTRDNSKEVELEQLLEKEKQENSKFKSEVFIFKLELEQQRTNVMNLQRELAAKTSDYMKRESATASASAKVTLPSGCNYKLFMEKNLDLSKESCSKVMVFGSKIKRLLISQKSSQPLFPGYGIRFCDFGTYRFTSFLNTGTKTPRDLCLNAQEDLCMAATMESTVKIFNLNNSYESASYRPVENGTIWSCAFDRQQADLLYLGSQAGTTYVYDQRNPRQVLYDIKSPEDSTPVINIVPVSSTDFGGILPKGGFLVCQMRALWFHEYMDSNVINAYRLGINGPFSSMSFDPRTQLILITTKPSLQFKCTRYVLAKLQRNGGVVVLQEVSSYEGSKIQLGAFTIPTQVKIQDNTLVAAYVQDCKTIQMWDTNIGKLQPLGMSMTDCVVDTCAIYMENNNVFLGALSETKCRIFKLIESENYLSYVTRLIN